MNTSHYNSLLLRYSEESYCVAQRLRGISVLCVNVIMHAVSYAYTDNNCVIYLTVVAACKTITH